MIVQKDCFQGHWHNNRSSGASSGTGNGNESVGGSSFDGKFVRDATTDGVHGTPRIGNETRPLNFTYKLWKRIA